MSEHVLLAQVTVLTPPKDILNTSFLSEAYKLLRNPSQPPPPPPNLSQGKIIIQISPPL